MSSLRVPSSNLVVPPLASTSSATPSPLAQKPNWLNNPAATLGAPGLLQPPSVGFPNLEQVGRSIAPMVDVPPRFGSPKPEVPPLHKAIEDNQLLELTRLLATGADIHSVNADGMTPLHLAAKLEDTGVINELLRRGARLDMRNKRGHTPLETALVYRSPGAALLLAQEMLRRPIDVAPWPDRAAVAEAFKDRMPGTSKMDTEALDKLTKSFNNAEGDLNTYPDLFKYYTHLGSLTGRFGGLAAEGWNFAPMLWQRMRSVVALIAQPFPVPQPKEFTEAETRLMLLDTLTSCLRSLHIAEICHAAAGNGTEVQKAATNVLGREIVSQALKLPVGQELVVPFGTTSHAIYAGLRQANVRGVPVLQCRIDNLGAGFRRSHVQDKVSGKVAPLTFNLPLVCLQQTACATAFTELIANLLRDMDDSHVSVKMLYARVLSFAQQVQGDPTLLEAQTNSSQHMAQSAGNCTLKNHTAALGAGFTQASRQKLGASASDEAVQSLGTRVLRWFKDCERHIVIQRIQDAVVPDKMWKHYRDEAVVRLGEIVTDREARRNGRLERFFAKEHRDTLASKLSASELADVVRDGDVTAMTLLLKKGVDLSDQFETSRSTLLHEAVRSGNPAMVSLLLENGADAKAKDSDERTAADLARELGNGAVLAALVLHNATTQPENNADVESTLTAQLKAIQEALTKLHKPTVPTPAVEAVPSADLPKPPTAPMPPAVAVMDRANEEDVEMADAF